MADPDDDLFRNRARASSFGQRAQLYDRTRPRYPAELIDALVDARPGAVLDVGCGTGLLGRSFVERGLPVLGVEPDAQMAAIARTHGLEVEEATFEGWAPRDRRFGLLVSGQAWHWVDPEPGATKAASVVEPGGTVAHAWNVGAFDPDVAEVVAEVYERLGAGQAHPVVPHHRERTTETAFERAFAATGCFERHERLEYPWDQPYTTEEWLAQLETHSDHALMDPVARAKLLEGVGEAIDANGSGFVMRYVCEVVRYRRR